MRLGSAILIFGLFLLANLGQPSLPTPKELVFWDQSIATAVNSSLAVDEACRPSPYATLSPDLRQAIS